MQLFTSGIKTSLQWVDGIKIALNATLMNMFRGSFEEKPPFPNPHPQADLFGPCHPASILHSPQPSPLHVAMKLTQLDLLEVEETSVVCALITQENTIPCIFPTTFCQEVMELSLRFWRRWSLF